MENEINTIIKEECLINIEDINKEIVKLEGKKNLLERMVTIDTYDVNLLVYIKYIQIEHVGKVANQINELNYRVKTDHSNRKHTSNDISEIIKVKNLINDDEIDFTAKELFYSNKKKSLKFT